MQFLQDGGVGFGEAVVRDFCARNPAPALTFKALRGDVPREADVVEVKDDFRTTVAVVVVGQGFAREIQAEFFAQFAQQRGFVAFTGFDFTAGKFPVARPGFVRRAFGDEELAVRVFDDGSDDGERGGHDGFFWVGLVGMRAV